MRRSKFGAAGCGGGLQSPVARLAVGRATRLLCSALETRLSHFISAAGGRRGCEGWWQGRKIINRRPRCPGDRRKGQESSTILLAFFRHLAAALTAQTALGFSSFHLVLTAGLFGTWQGALTQPPIERVAPRQKKKPPRRPIPGTKPKAAAPHIAGTSLPARGSAPAQQPDATTCTHRRPDPDARLASPDGTCGSCCRRVFPRRVHSPCSLARLIQTLRAPHHWRPPKDTSRSA